MYVTYVIHSVIRKHRLTLLGYALNNNVVQVPRTSDNSKGKGHL